MTQVLAQLATHTAALLLYPGLVMIALFGGAAESVWVRVSEGSWVRPELPRHRPSAVLTTVALSSMLAAVQMSAPFNLVPSDERNLIIAAIALGLTVWAELALGTEMFAEPGLLLVVQCCWLVAVLGPAVEPQSLRPQVLGAVLVPSLLPLKVASGILYLLCLPALLKVWPVPAPGERRARRRLDALRALCWWPYCGLFATLFFPPTHDDLLGLAGFLGVSVAAAGFCVLAGAYMRRRGLDVVRDAYGRAVAPFAGLVLVLVAVTSLLVR
ncbi:MAG: hypothetical protein E6I23_11700 [Chloroflexi bacterium]|nr:MAG: hypothetical protein E6I23_11700 [Chloroflexota bacterium]